MENIRLKSEPVVTVNKNFKKCMLFVSFPIYDVDYIKISILKKMVFDKSSIYNTDKKIYEVNVNNYCLSYSGRIVSYGNNYFLELMLFYPCYDSLGIDVLEDNLKFINEIIYNPYLEDGTFPEKDINDIKNIIKNNIAMNFNDGLWYFKYKNDKIIDEDNYLNSEMLDDPSLLDGITSYDIYDLYKNIISRPPIVFLMGNVDECKAKDSIKRILLDNKFSDIEFENKYRYYAKNIISTPHEITENVKFKSTGIAYNYKVRNLKDEKDIALLKIIKMLFYSTSSSYLYDIFRRDNDLVYRCGTYCYSTFGSLTLWVMTGSKNIDIVKNIFDNILNDINDINFIEEKLKLIKDEVKLDDDLCKESIYKTLMVDFDKYIGFCKKSFYEYIKDINTLDVKEFIDNRLVLVSKYIGVGEEDE